MNVAPTLTALFGWPLLILALAIYSITRLITTDSIIDRQRDWVYDRFPHEGYQSKHKPKRGTSMQVSGGLWYVTKGHKLGELIHCPWCSGFWVAAAVFAAFVAWPVATTFVLVPLALRVVPGMIQSALD